MSSFEIFWVVGCVVSFICGLLTPFYSKQKNFTLIDFLYAIVCGFGGWIYAIIFVLGVVWWMVSTKIYKSEREASTR